MVLRWYTVYFTCVAVFDTIDLWSETRVNKVIEYKFITTIREECLKQNNVHFLMSTGLPVGNW